MKAAVLRTGGTLAITDVAEPIPGPGELVLAVRACGICGSDLHAAHAMAPGTIFGHEFSGEVAAVGDGVAGWSVGERAVSLPFFCCGRCPRCMAGDGILCAEMRGIGVGPIPGAYAERVRVQPANTLRIPQHVTDREAALVEPLAVGLHGVRRSGLRAGETCVVLGAGPIGIATQLWALELGARVVVADPSPGRRAIAERLGANAAVDPGRDAPEDVARETFGSAPAVVFECVGVRGLIQSAMSLAPIRGRIVVLGVCLETDEIFPLQGVLKELSLDFVLGYGRGEFAEALDAVASRRIDPLAMVTDVVPLDALPSAFAALATPSTECKVQVELR